MSTVQTEDASNVSNMRILSTQSRESLCVSGLEPRLRLGSRELKKYCDSLLRVLLSGCRLLDAVWVSGLKDISQVTLLCIPNWALWKVASHNIHK